MKRIIIIALALAAVGCGPLEQGAKNQAAKEKKSLESPYSVDQANSVACYGRDWAKLSCVHIPGGVK